MKVRVYVSLKPTVLDPQGQAIAKALRSHGHPSVQEVRQGKYFEITFPDDLDPNQIRREIDTIARDVLANPVIEDFRVAAAE